MKDKAAELSIIIIVTVKAKHKHLKIILHDLINIESRPLEGEITFLLTP